MSSTNSTSSRKVLLKLAFEWPHVLNDLFTTLESKFANILSGCQSCLYQSVHNYFKSAMTSKKFSELKQELSCKCDYGLFVISFVFILFHVDAT